MQKVLITGAAGAIGSVLREGFHGVYGLVRCSDIREQAPARKGEELHQGDIIDMAAMERAMEGMDAVVHLGGTPREADWESIHRNNIVGCYTAYEAARRQGVRRFIFASSNHANGYYRRTRRVSIDDPVRPDSRYGVSKVFGEALGRMYADKYGMEVVCLRIGSFRKEPTDRRMLHSWIGHADTVRLARAAVEAPKVHFEVIYGVGANNNVWWDTRPGERLGFQPEESADAFADALANAASGAGPIGDIFQGGYVCDAEFVGSPDRID
ncbi:MAG: NAD-dependent epimerase/dehydratase family protein [Bdellovibrionales bacterium]